MSCRCSTPSTKRADTPAPFRVSLRDGSRPVLLGVTERLEYVDTPGHAEDLKRYYARGYAMKGNRIRIVTDHEADLIDVHPPLRGAVDLGGLTVERCPSRPWRRWMEAGSAS